MPPDFLNQDCGTENSDDDKLKQEEIANNVLQGISPESGLMAKSIPLNKSYAFNEKITNASALVLSNQEHWYCVVDSDLENLYIACSWSLHDGCEESKSPSPRLGRVYNRTIRGEALHDYLTITP